MGLTSIHEEDEDEKTEESQGSLWHNAEHEGRLYCYDTRRPGRRWWRARCGQRDELVILSDARNESLGSRLCEQDPFRFEG